jgi:hypothetical protein
LAIFLSYYTKLFFSSSHGAKAYRKMKKAEQGAALNSRHAGFSVDVASVAPEDWHACCYLAWVAGVSEL